MKLRTRSTLLPNLPFITATLVAIVGFIHQSPEIPYERLELHDSHPDYSYILEREKVPPYNNTYDNNKKIKDILPREYISPNISLHCGPTEIGPFISISTPLNGVCNQFHYLQGMFVLLADFKGTIVLPRYVSTRKSLRKGQVFHDWDWVPIEDLFDISYLIGYWRKRGKHICLQSDYVHYWQPDLIPLQYQFSEYKTMLRTCKTTYSQCFLKAMQHFMRFHYGHIKTNYFIYMPNLWGVNPISPLIESIEDPRMQISIESALGIRFSKRLIDVGRRIYRELKLIGTQKGLDGVTVIHLRVERDWQAHMKIIYPRLMKQNVPTDQLKELLSFYTARFQDYKPEGLVYLAHGKLKPDEQQIVDKWANLHLGDRWITKHSLKAISLLRGLSGDQRGVADLVASVIADRFIGQGTSSMGYLVSEIRSYLHKESGMALGFASLFRPMLATRQLPKVLIDPLAV